jgi:hypothetical protein
MKKEFGSEKLMSVKKPDKLRKVVYKKRGIKHLN